MTVFLESWRELEEWTVNVSEEVGSNITAQRRRSMSTAIPWYIAWALISVLPERHFTVIETLLCWLFQGFGRARHAVSTEKIKTLYPDYEVTWADEGYWVGLNLSNELFQDMPRQNRALTWWWIKTWFFLHLMEPFCVLTSKEWMHMCLCP